MRSAHVPRCQVLAKVVFRHPWSAGLCASGGRLQARPSITPRTGRELRHAVHLYMPRGLAIGGRAHWEGTSAARSTVGHRWASHWRQACPETSAPASGLGQKVADALRDLRALRDQDAALMKQSSETMDPQVWGAHRPDGACFRDDEELAGVAAKRAQRVQRSLPLPLVEPQFHHDGKTR
jgi:hypothetical protein